MSTPLIDALVERHGFALVGEANLDAFLDANEHSLLFFPGDADRLGVVDGSGTMVFADRYMIAMAQHALQNGPGDRFDAGEV